MKGLDAEALKDPKSIKAIVVASPTINSYSYAVAPNGCDNLKTDCTTYTLTANLESGTTFAKRSLN